MRTEIQGPDPIDVPTEADLHRLWRDWWQTEPSDQSAPLVDQLRQIDGIARRFGEQNTLVPSGLVDGPYERVIEENQGVWYLGHLTEDPAQGVLYGHDIRDASPPWPLAGLLYRACAIEAVFTHTSYRVRDAAPPAADELAGLRVANCIANGEDWNLPAVWQEDDVLMIGFDSDVPQFLATLEPDSELRTAGEVLELSAF